MGRISPSTVLLIVASVLVLLSVWLGYRAFLKDRARGRPRCPRCWYDMQGSPTLVCPECGHDARYQQHLFKTRRYRATALLSLLCLVLAVHIHYSSKRIHRHGERWQTAVIPTTAFITAYPWLTGSAEEAAFWRAGHLNTNAQWQTHLFINRFLHRHLTGRGTGAERERRFKEAVTLWDQSAIRTDDLLGFIEHPGVKMEYKCDVLGVIAKHAAASQEWPMLQPIIQRLQHKDPEMALAAQNGLSVFAQRTEAERFSTPELESAIDLAASLQRVFGIENLLVRYIRRPEARTAFLNQHAAQAPASSPHRLVFLTALRQLEKGPPPLAVASNTRQLLVRRTNESILLPIYVTCNENEPLPIVMDHLTSWGGTNGAIQAHITDAQGKYYPSHTGLVMLGGGPGPQPTLVDKTKRIEDYRLHLYALPAGEYELTLIYHPWRELHLDRETENLFVVHSEVIELKITQ